MRAKSETLTVFVPMWNEELSIRPSLAAIGAVCRDLVAEGDLGDYELLVVDDASTDATGAVADELAAADPHVRVVHHPVNRKLGGAIKTGLGHARGDLVLYTDADLPCDPAELRRALHLLRLYRADVVSAYRHDRTGEGARRAAYSFVYNWLCRVSFDIHVRDLNFAFKLLRRRVLDHVEVVSEGSFVDAELLIRAQRLGFHVIQFGVDYYPRSRGTSTLSSPAVITKILREMRSLRPELRRTRVLSTAALAEEEHTGSWHVPRPSAAASRVATPRLLIVNADDYGLTEGISRGILRAHREGIVTSTSVLAVGPALGRSGEWLGDHPDLGVGAHLALVGEDPPLLSAREVPSLVDGQGRFPLSWRRFLARAVAGRVDPDDVVRELGAQLERVAGLGVPLTHVDSHQHLHLWPSVTDAVVALATKHGIAALRVPRSLEGGARASALNRLSDRLARSAREAGMVVPAAAAGMDGSGRLDAEALEHSLARLAARGAPSAELGVHPGEADDPERARYRWGFHWGDELAALVAPEARRAVAAHGFTLGTYADLARSP